MKPKIILLAFLFCLSSGCLPGGSRPRSDLQRAEELSKEGRYEEAIEAYRSHIDYRLSLSSRPDWENPYLYLLMIGDEYLKQGKVDQALSSYEEAERRKVEQPLVNDRFRYVASWYEGRGELQKAFDILKRYRDRDPLLMDGMLDRISKEQVRIEDEAGRPGGS